LLQGQFTQKSENSVFPFYFTTLMSFQISMTFSSVGLT